MQLLPRRLTDSLDSFSIQGTEKMIRARPHTASLYYAVQRQEATDVTSLEASLLVSSEDLRNGLELSIRRDHSPGQPRCSTRYCHHRRTGASHISCYFFVERPAGTSTGTAEKLDGFVPPIGTSRIRRVRPWIASPFLFRSDKDNRQIVWTS